VAEGVDRDAGGEIEIAFAVGGCEPCPFAPIKSKVNAGVCGQ